MLICFCSMFEASQPPVFMFCCMSVNLSLIVADYVISSMYRRVLLMFCWTSDNTALVFALEILMIVILWRQPRQVFMLHI